MKTFLSPRFLMIIPALILGGCAQSSVQTVVRRDGTWTRNIEWRGTGLRFEGQPPSDEVDKAYRLPDEKTWNVTSGFDKDTRVYRAQREFRAGETSRGDLRVVGKIKDKPQDALTNEVTLRKIGPELWQYLEVLRWKGEQFDLAKIPSGDYSEREITKLVQKALPPALATPQNVREISRRIQRALW